MNVDNFFPVSKFSLLLLVFFVSTRLFSLSPRSFFKKNWDQMPLSAKKIPSLEAFVEELDGSENLNLIFKKYELRCSTCELFVDIPYLKKRRRSFIPVALQMKILDCEDKNFSQFIDILSLLKQGEDVNDRKICERMPENVLSAKEDEKFIQQSPIFHSNSR